MQTLLNKHTLFSWIKQRRVFKGCYNFVSPVAGRTENTAPSVTACRHVNSAARLHWFRRVTELLCPAASMAGGGRSTRRLVDSSTVRGTTCASATIWPGWCMFTEYDKDLEKRDLRIYFYAIKTSGGPSFCLTCESSPACCSETSGVRWREKREAAHGREVRRPAAQSSLPQAAPTHAWTADWRASAFEHTLTAHTHSQSPRTRDLLRKEWKTILHINTVQQIINSLITLLISFHTWKLITQSGLMLHRNWTGVPSKKYRTNVTASSHAATCNNMTLSAGASLLSWFLS